MEQSVVERFWAKVQKRPNDECWLWLGAKWKSGYGQLRRYKTQRWLAHRVSWEIANGRAPALHVLHKCDNPSCVRPDHLYEGTNAENMRDKVDRGRQARGSRHGSKTKPESIERGNKHWSHRDPSRRVRGERHGSAKLTWVSVREIRHLHASGVSQYKLASQFGVCRASIAGIISGRRWKE